MKNFMYIIFMLVLGKGIYNEFNFETLRFEKLGLSILYLIVFFAFAFLLIKNNINKKSNG
jgi:hypothetical protein